MYIYIYLSVCVYIYIYIEREREIHIHTYIHNMYSESRERPGTPPSESSAHARSVEPLHSLANPSLVPALAPSRALMNPMQESKHGESVYLEHWR